MGALSVTSDIIGAGTALAGLMLVYIGFQIADFGTYSATEKKTVKPKFQLRAGLAVVGVILALLAALAALLTKAAGDQNFAIVPITLAVIAFLWTIVIAVANVWEIK